MSQRQWISLTLLWGGVLLCGCASLPLHLYVPPAPMPVEERPSIFGDYKDYRGVIHCHSFLSHDSRGQIADIAAAAQASGLDFVMMTDHITPEAIAHGVTGMQGTTLFILGAEIAQANGSILGIGLKRFVEHKQKKAQEIIDALKAQDAAAIIAYPEKFRDWSVSGYDGLEIYNLKSDVQDEYKFSLLLSFLFLPPRSAFAHVIDRPKEKLALWDHLSQSRHLVGVAGTNAHNNVRVLGRTFGTYSQLFQLLTNHLLARNLTEEDLLLALQAGHAYVAFDLFGSVPFFLFSAGDDRQQAIMGETISFSSSLRGEVCLPERAEVHVLKDGAVWRKEEALFFRFPITEAGVYRVEVYKGRKPWIFSNPIYVVAPSP